MRAILVVLALTAAALAAPSEFIPPFRDFEDYGIARTERIKATEEAMDFDGRITGGHLAVLGWFPWMAGLVIDIQNGGRTSCGATLLSNTRLVTAAHCWGFYGFQARQFTVVLGSIRLFTGGVRIPTNQVTRHPNYTGRSMHNDIAIIRINHVAFNAHINRVNLPANNHFYVGMRATAVGFGQTGQNVPISPNQALSYVYVYVMTNQVCQRYVGAPWDPSILCTSGAGGRGPCPGDSGGPLVVWGPVLIGVVSFVSGQGCQSGYPAGYTRVSSFLPWIRSHL